MQRCTVLAMKWMIGFWVLALVSACDLAQVDPVGDALDDSGNGSVNDSVNDSKNSDSSGTDTPETENTGTSGAPADTEERATENTDSAWNGSDSDDTNSSGSCGNGIVEPEYEECDDGENSGGAGKCGPDCKMVPADGCGNGVLDANFGEMCDDGNTVSLDGCSSSCQPECGFDCEKMGQPCVPDCANLLVYSCIVEGALEMCCDEETVHSSLEEWCRAREGDVTVDELTDGTWSLVIDRKIEKPGEFPLDRVPVESDYTMIPDGDIYVITFYENQQRLKIVRGEQELGGVRIEKLADSFIFEIDSGLFAGGQLTVFVHSSELNGELLVNGSGVPLIEAVRGTLTKVTVD